MTVEITEAGWEEQFAKLDAAAQQRIALSLAKKAKKNVQHSMADDDHGTPTGYIELARYALGAIDLDPMSSGYWNHWSVKATRFYDEHANGTIQPLYGRMILNPAGGDTIVDGKVRSIPRTMWERTIQHYRDGRVHSTVFIGYSLEQLVQLQNSPMHPLQFLTLVPAERLEFLKRPPKGGGPPLKGKSPTHGNFITLLPTRTSPTQAGDQVRRFIEMASRLDIGGAIVRPL